MSRSYEKHGLMTLITRQKRRRHGPIDRRTREGRNAEATRQALINDHGGENASAATLLVIESLVVNATWRAEVDRVIAQHIKEDPDVRNSPKALSRLFQYRAAMDNAVSRNLQTLGLGKVEKAGPTWRELLNEDQNDEQGGAK